MKYLLLVACITCELSAYKLANNPSQSADSHIFFCRPCVCTGCPGENVPDFGRMFLTLKYTDLTQNTYIRSLTVTEIMAREKCGLLAVPRIVPVSRVVIVHCACPSFSLTAESSTFRLHYQQMSQLQWVNCNSILLDIHVPCKVFGTLRTTTTLVRVHAV